MRCCLHALAHHTTLLLTAVDDVRKLATSQRRHARDERVMIHFNGHGVPRPTKAGELWVFNKLYTQYVPLPVAHLQQWTGDPSLYVFDCAGAGILLPYFSGPLPPSTTATEIGPSVTSPTTPAGPRNCIVFAACGAEETLPSAPELPADLFTGESRGDRIEGSACRSCNR